MTKATNATYAKLRDGSWGLRITGGTVAAGQRVLAVKRDGTGKDEIVGSVVWSGDGVTLATIARSGSGSRSQRGGSGTSRYCRTPNACQDALQWDAPDRLCSACSRYHDAY